MSVWGVWTWGFPGTARPAAFCVRRAWWCCPCFVRERASVVGVAAGGCPRALASFGVGFALLAARYRLWFVVRASDVFLWVCLSLCVFLLCLVVYVPWGVSGGGVVTYGGWRWRGWSVWWRERR